MANTDFYLKLAGTLLLSLSAASAMTTGMELNGVIAGLLAVSAVALLRSAESSSRREGRTDSMKVALVSTTLLYELVLLLGASAVAGKFVSVFAVAAVGFSEMLHVEMREKLKKSLTPDIGRDGRVVLLAVALAGYSFNSWVLFYGLTFIGLLAVYDSLTLIHRLRGEL